ncbi:protein MRVI1-like [Oryzias latipes]|uniref:protein MRVI1-like n=1 Tax=Oryzias latipes TaxID=8090 RepID=UPI0005CB8A96|nr:protein MRVI1-like [Oryzias latipes]
MSLKPDRELRCRKLSIEPDSDDSQEDVSREETPLPGWNELSIIERVGLNSVEMSEKDLEVAFSQIALAFRCDQYTLKQRLQAEEHARNLAEENIQLELSRGRETLEMLKGLCLDSKRSTILQKLQLSLDILGGTVERISNTAEVLGAVHQEARMSRAVELMVAHVESLRRRHDKNVAELEEMKKMMQQHPSSYRNSINPTTSPEPEESDKMKNSKEGVLRRRISASIMSCQSQEKKKKDPRKRGFSGKKLTPSCSSPSLILESTRVTKEDRQPNQDLPEASAPTSTLEPPPAPKLEVSPSVQVIPKTTQSKNVSLDSLRLRHKGKDERFSRGREKKAASILRQIAIYANRYGSLCWQHPLTLRLYRCRWTHPCLNLLVLFCVIMTILFLWKLYDDDP